jgi:hypothetical protein
MKKHILFYHDGYNIKNKNEKINEKFNSYPNYYYKT